MATESEYDDRMVEKSENRIIWAIRTTFQVVFYKKNDEVGPYDYFVVACTFVGFSLLTLFLRYAFIAVTEGFVKAGDAATSNFTVAKTPEEVLGSVALILMAAPPLMLTVAVYKSLSGGLR